MSNNNALISLCLQVLQIFCGNNNNNNQHQNQQQGYPQQHQNYPQQQQPTYPGQQQGYPGQQQGAWGNNNQQQQYPPQQQQQWGQQDGPGHKPTIAQGAKPPAGFTTAGGKLDDNKYYSSDPQYKKWRDDARREGDLAHKCSQDSQNAYKSGDGARAKQLSDEAKTHRARQDDLNRQAAAWIHNKVNLDQKPDELDLHGLYVKEAIEVTEQAITRAQQQGIPVLHIIVGKGNHSAGHQAKIKPAIEDLMRKYNLAAQINPKNAGVLDVYLQGQGGTRDAGFVDQMGKNDQDCVIM